ncbi:hypothetical protein BFP70_16205 [Thioclava sp. SK-1]|uniref:HTTM domain-containing protein n=1 Tax=Thioclava sp. SK-1 TaxID=1889770 RepID=UPI0008254B4D|nr:HTTM domain-containing protein [Thioclava sp. SK-1]OCX61005.1 hypothetical protein BFP70_16205 [Thioclava sp. SK-1]
MTLEFALRLTEMLLALAFLQQSAEHMNGFADAKRIHFARICLCFWLLLGWHSDWALAGLTGLGVVHLIRFQGPYNGGSDRMGLLILFCLTTARWVPAQYQELALGYIGVQLVISYVWAGWVKLRNPEWRQGRALHDVFLFSAYPVCTNLRGWANHPRLLWAMGWGVMILEFFFPLSLLDQQLMMAALCVAAAFHLSNAIFFGLNRFLWVWLAAYPSLIWLQGRIV